MKRFGPAIRSLKQSDRPILVGLGEQTVQNPEQIRLEAGYRSSHRNGLKTR